MSYQSSLFHYERVLSERTDAKQEVGDAPTFIPASRLYNVQARERVPFEWRSESGEGSR